MKMEHSKSIKKTFKLAYLLYESLKIQILKKTVHTTHQIKCKINWGTGLSSENEAIAPVTLFLFEKPN